MSEQDQGQGFGESQSQNQEQDLDVMLEQTSRLKFADLIFSYQERMENPEQGHLTPKLIVNPHVLTTHHLIIGESIDDLNPTLVTTRNQLQKLIHLNSGGDFFPKLISSISDATPASSSKELHVRDAMVGFILLTDSLISQEGVTYTTGLSNLLKYNSKELEESTQKLLPKIELNSLNFLISPVIDSRYQIPEYQSELKDYVDMVVKDKSIPLTRGFELGVIAGLNFNEIWWNKIKEIGDFSNTQVSTGSTLDLTTQSDLPITA